MSTKVAKLAEAEDGELAPIRFGKFTIASTGLLVEGNPTFEEWQKAGHLLLVMARGLQFAVGDWLNYGEDKFGEMAAQVIDARDWTEETVRVYRWVSARVPPQNRRITNEITFSHHQAVAKLPPKRQRELLKLAAKDKDDPWSVAKLKNEIRKTEPREEKDDAPKYWVLVEARDIEDQALLKKEMEQSGRRCKLIGRKDGT
jgi:hypothetical protein